MPHEPPAYHSEPYWDERFKKEEHFEWLGDGSDTIVPVLRKYLEQYTSNPPKTTNEDAGPSVIPSPPKLLHIGVGTSTLHEQLRGVYEEVFAGRPGGSELLKDVIVNTDFSEQAVEKGRQASVGQSMVCWEQVDLLRWGSLEELKRKELARIRNSELEGNVGGKEGEPGPYNIVIDKSTSDAISCGEDLKFRDGDDTSKMGMHPNIASMLSKTPSHQFLVLEPVELLAIHLASLWRPNCIKNDFHAIQRFSNNMCDILTTEHISTPLNCSGAGILSGTTQGGRISQFSAIRTT
ncbi:hypothetical protein K474DRAFT_1090789 [Panus rudis PR-1116 ss-1]|nr:hypothetical protein K474DRAFT_1090789 [Panus rudis PR-1116 ss-1]